MLACLKPHTYVPPAVEMKKVVRFAEEEEEEETTKPPAEGEETAEVVVTEWSRFRTKRNKGKKRSGGEVTYVRPIGGGDRQ